MSRLARIGDVIEYKIGRQTKMSMVIDATERLLYLQNGDVLNRSRNTEYRNSEGVWVR